jgi:hypothetical protein
MDPSLELNHGVPREKHQQVNRCNQPQPSALTLRLGRDNPLKGLKP